MARGKGHLIKLADVPGIHNKTPRVGVRLKLLHQVLNLVDGSAGVSSRRRWPRHPLPAVDGPKFSLGIGPFVPDGNAGCLEAFDVGLPTQKPQEFMDDAFGVELFCGDERKSLFKLEPHLPTKDRSCAGSCSITFFCTMLKNMLHELVVLPHDSGPMAAIILKPEST